MSVRLVYSEARAALARAERLGRLAGLQHTKAVRELDAVINEIDTVEVAPGLTRDAGELAHKRGLRGSDAVHLASALTLADADLVLVTGDTELAAAAAAAGLAYSAR